VQNNLHSLASRLPNLGHFEVPLNSYPSAYYGAGSRCLRTISPVTEQAIQSISHWDKLVLTLTLDGRESVLTPTQPRNTTSLCGAHPLFLDADVLNSDNSAKTSVMRTGSNLKHSVLWAPRLSYQLALAFRVP
jgi:hypothetical protein